MDLRIGIPTLTTIGQRILVLAAFAVLVSALSLAVVFFVGWYSAQETNRQHAHASAISSAGHIANLAGLLRQTLLQQAGDARLAAAISQANPALIQAEEERLTRTLTAAWLVRLVAENLDTPDESRSPRMGFAGLNMVKEAASGNLQPAVHLAGTPDAHIALAQRLTSGGVILASWPVNMLQTALATAADGACGLELRQDNLPLAFSGQPNCKSGPPSGEIAVSETTWKVVYWVEPNVPTNQEWYLVSLLSVGLLIGGFAWFLNRHLAQAVKTDIIAITALLTAWRDGKPSSKQTFQLQEFNQLSDSLAHLVRLPREAAAPASTAEVPLFDFGNFDPPKETKLDKTMEFVEPLAKTQKATTEISPSIFRAYDIRGVVGETITPEVVYAIARAIGATMAEQGEFYIAIACDGRHSSPSLSESLAKGLLDSGRTVINLGMVPTPLLYFAAQVIKANSAVMLTGSHNPANYNGLKIIIGGNTLTEADIQALRLRIESKDFVDGLGRMDHYNLLPEYLERVVSDTQLGRNLKVVIDCGNGVAALVAPKLIRALGCEVIELFCEVDGQFPNHHPDPSQPENLYALIDKVLETDADLGIAFDGDGDRLGVVDSHGKIIWPDRQMMLFAADVLSREPGADILYDVKCSRNLPSQIVKSGGRPLMCKSGHAPMKIRMKETGAALAGELTGHIFFRERWYGFDDAIYASARMLEIVSNAYEETSHELFATLPDSFTTPELSITLEEGENVRLMETLIALADFPDARITTIDGLRLDFNDGFGLVRASNTLPALTFRFEGDTELAMVSIKQHIEALIRQVRPEIELPF